MSPKISNEKQISAAPAPTLRLVEKSAEEVTIEITRPSPPKGHLVTYNVTYTDDTVRKNLDYVVESGLQQNITMTNLNSHTPYTFIVSVLLTFYIYYTLHWQSKLLNLVRRCPMIRKILGPFPENHRSQLLSIIIVFLDFFGPVPKFSNIQHLPRYEL